MGRPCTHESRGILEVWWFKLQEPCEEAASELDAHRARTRVSQMRTASKPDTHHARARHAPRAHQMGIARAPNLGGAYES